MGYNYLLLNYNYTFPGCCTPVLSHLLSTISAPSDCSYFLTNKTCAFTNLRCEFINWEKIVSPAHSARIPNAVRVDCGAPPPADPDVQPRDSLASSRRNCLLSGRP